MMFISDSNNSTVINFIKNNNFTIVHIMYDDLIILVPEIYNYCNKILYKTHYAYIPQFLSGRPPYSFLNELIKYNHLVNIFAISQEIKNIYIQAGVPGDRIQVIHNGASEDNFIYKQIPLYPDRTIYIGKIEFRKRQYLYTSIPNIYFAGHYYNSDFKSDNYLGSWDKETLYNNVTDYANILLMSDGEAYPLVIK